MARTTSQLGRLGAAVLGGLLISTAAACTTEPAYEAWNMQGDQHVWAVGDSQAAASNDVRRGPGWAERLGAEVGNGAARMHGAGWTVPGTVSLESIGSRMLSIASADQADMIVVMAGVNDLRRAPLATMTTAVEDVDRLADAQHVEVVFVTIPPFPPNATIRSYEAKRRAFNEFLVSQYPERTIDCESDLSSTAGVLPVSYAMAADDLHLNDAGLAVLADCIRSHAHFNGN